MEEVLLINSAIQGDREIIQTPFGPICVTIAGNRNLTPLLTFHDVGINHQSCFQQLMMCSNRNSLLIRNFCFYHIDAPGCEEGGECVPEDGKALTAENIVDQVSAVVRHLKLREVVGFGVGMGGYILASFAARYPKETVQITVEAPGHVQDIVGLILASPLCKKSTWWEYGFGRKTAYYLWLSGWVDSAAKHLSHRLFSPQSCSANGGAGSDLVQSYKRQTVLSISPKAVSCYLTAAINRQDISSDLIPKIRCKTLVMSGYYSAFEADSLQLNVKLKPGLGSWVEVEEAGTLITEERPQMMLQSIQLFLQGLQQLGHGLDWNLTM